MNIEQSQSHHRKKVKELPYEWILEEPSPKYRQKLQYFVGYLMMSVSDSPNNLIEDKKRIAESLGIKITLSPACVKYFPRSERVSVKHSASTATKEDAIQWGKIAPPNDDRKQYEVESWLRKEGQID